MLQRLMRVERCFMRMLMMILTMMMTKRTLKRRPTAAGGVLTITMMRWGDRWAELTGRCWADLACGCGGHVSTATCGPGGVHPVQVSHLLSEEENPLLLQRGLYLRQPHQRPRHLKICRHLTQESELRWWSWMHRIILEAVTWRSLNWALSTSCGNKYLEEHKW